VKSAVLRVMEGMYGSTGVVDLQASQGDSAVDRFIANNTETVTKVLDTVERVAGPTLRRIKRRRGQR
jgi:hypothetical protein